MTVQQMLALKQVADAIIESVKECGSSGAPAGPMYAALMSRGCTLEQFEQIMSGLVKAGKLRKSGNIYYAM